MISTSIPELVGKSHEIFKLFIQSVYNDLRSLGIILVELYLRRPLTSLEKNTFRSLNFHYTDLMAYNSMDRLSKGMMQLLQLCFTPLPNNVIIESFETNKHGEETLYLKSSLLKNEEDILELLEKEFNDIGGIEPREGLTNKPKETLWTQEVQVSL